MDFFPLPIKSSGGRRWTLKPSGGAEKMEKQEPGRVEKNWWRLVTNGETLEEAGMLTRRPPGNHWLMLARWPTKEQRQVFAVRQQETTVWCQPGKLTWKFAESPTRNRWLVSAMPQNNQGAGVSQAVDRGTGSWLGRQPRTKNCSWPGRRPRTRKGRGLGCQPKNRSKRLGSGAVGSSEDEHLGCEKAGSGFPADSWAAQRHDIGGSEASLSELACRLGLSHRIDTLWWELRYFGGGTL